MSVILELSLPAEEFELGRIFMREDGASITLETMVPLGERAVPFLRFFDDMAGSFEETIRNHPAVNQLNLVESHDGERLYALDWQPRQDDLFEGIREMNAHPLEATGTTDTWEFKLRFPSHEALSAFQEHCDDNDIRIEIERVYNPTAGDAGPWYGLTDRQRETLVCAVEAGYYSVPRQTTAQNLAAEFEVSDQAVTERLRRGIDTLVRNTFIDSEDA